MSILHTVNHVRYSLFEHSVLPVLQGGDTLLLMDNGVYLSLLSPVQRALEGVGCDCWLLANDAQCRGVTPLSLFVYVTMDQVVEAHVRYEKTLTWHVAGQ